MLREASTMSDENGRAEVESRSTGGLPGYREIAVEVWRAKRPERNSHCPKLFRHQEGRRWALNVEQRCARLEDGG